MDLVYARGGGLTTLNGVVAGTTKVLNVEDNDITDISAIVEGLQVLFISNNPHLATLPNISSLYNILADNCSIPNSVVLGANLAFLSLQGNGLTNLSFLQTCTNLQYLNVGNNNLASLQYTPDTVTDLRADFNNITTLQHLPLNTRRLDISSNPLSSLSTLPVGHSLNMLDIGNTDVTSLLEIVNSCTVYKCNSCCDLTNVANSASVIISIVNGRFRPSTGTYMPNDEGAPRVNPITFLSSSSGVAASIVMSTIASMYFPGNRTAVSRCSFIVNVSAGGTMTLRFVFTPRGGSEHTVFEKVVSSTDDGVDFRLSCVPSKLGKLELRAQKSSALVSASVYSCLLY